MICGLLLEGVLGKAFSANLQILHIGGHFATQILVDIELGKILSKHEAVATETGAETHFGVDDVARLGVASCPDGKESDFTKVGYPFGKDFGDYLKELLAVVLDVLTGFVGIGPL